MRRTARLSFLVGLAVFLLMIWRTVIFHVAGRFRVLLWVHGRHVHAEGVGAVKRFRAMFAAESFEFPGRSRRSWATLDVSHVLLEPALREMPCKKKGS